MNTLKNFNKLIDSHIHDIPGISKKFVKAPFKQSVRCLNIYPENRHQSNMPYYEIAFNENDTPKTILGVGATVDEMLAIIEDNRFIGYGEFVLYKHYTDIYTNEKKIADEETDKLKQSLDAALGDLEQVQKRIVDYSSEIDEAKKSYIDSLQNDTVIKGNIQRNGGFTLTKKV